MRPSPFSKELPAYFSEPPSLLARAESSLFGVNKAAWCNALRAVRRLTEVLFSREQRSCQYQTVRKPSMLPINRASRCSATLGSWCSRPLVPRGPCAPLGSPWPPRVPQLPPRSSTRPLGRGGDRYRMPACHPARRHTLRLVTLLPGPPQSHPPTVLLQLHPRPCVACGVCAPGLLPHEGKLQEPIRGGVASFFSPVPGWRRRCGGAGDFTRGHTRQALLSALLALPLVFGHRGQNREVRRKRSGRAGF